MPYSMVQFRMISNDLATFSTTQSVMQSVMQAFTDNNRASSKCKDSAFDTH